MVRYFSLEHRTEDQMNPKDRELLHSRTQELAAVAAIFGYDLSAPGWNLDQAICPALPGSMLLHYRKLSPNASQSLFAAVVPRGTGRVRVVPSLHANASTFQPAVKDIRNYRLFHDLIPAPTAQRDITVEGDWLPLAVCYAELIGARPNVPDEPDLDTAMLLAPSPTLHIDQEAKTAQIQFPDREGEDKIVVWTIDFDKSARIIRARAEDYATFVAKVVRPDEPTGKVGPIPLEAGSKLVAPTEQPSVTVNNNSQMAKPAFAPQQR